MIVGLKVKCMNYSGLYIEDDNLEVLKLLQENYLNSIKIIYFEIKTKYLIRFNAA